jgi:hypothetical protein
MGLQTEADTWNCTLMCSMSANQKTDPKMCTSGTAQSLEVTSIRSLKQSLKERNRFARISLGSMGPVPSDEQNVRSYFWSPQVSHQGSRFAQHLPNRFGTLSQSHIRFEESGHPHRHSGSYQWGMRGRESHRQESSQVHCGTAWINGNVLLLLQGQKLHICRFSSYVSSRFWERPSHRHKRVLPLGKVWSLSRGGREKGVQMCRWLLESFIQRQDPRNVQRSIRWRKRFWPWREFSAWLVWNSRKNDRETGVYSGSMHYYMEYFTSEPIYS